MAPATTVTLPPSKVTTGMSFGPQHREVRLDHLVGRGQVEPDLEQLGRVRCGRVDEREHLAVHDAGAGREPLRVAASETGRGTQRVGVVDQPPAHQRDGLEATMGMLGKPGHLGAVIHAPAVARLEVGCRSRDPRAIAPRRTESTVARGVQVEVVDAEQERVDRRPLEPQRHFLQHRIVHASTLGYGLHQRGDHVAELAKRAHLEHAAAVRPVVVHRRVGVAPLALRLGVQPEHPPGLRGDSSSRPRRRPGGSWCGRRRR